MYVCMYVYVFCFYMIMIDIRTFDLYEDSNQISIVLFLEIERRR